MRYAQITQAGVCVGLLDTPKAIDAPNMVLLGDSEQVALGDVYADGAWSTPTPPTPTERWVTTYRFLFQLHDLTQQVMIDAVHTAAMALGPSQILDFDPQSTDANGYPLQVLRVFRLAYEQMDKLAGRVDLLSADLNTFFQAAAAVGIYGETGEQITAEIARIKSDTRPDA